MSDRVAVMYQGQIVEVGESGQVLDAPQHPYTQLLMASVPRIGAPLHTELPSNRHLSQGGLFPRSLSLCL